MLGLGGTSISPRCSPMEIDVLACRDMTWLENIDGHRGNAEVTGSALALVAGIRLDALNIKPKIEPENQVSDRPAWRCCDVAAIIQSAGVPIGAASHPLFGNLFADDGIHDRPMTQSPC